jgi:hypothetical protein
MGKGSKDTRTPDLTKRRANHDRIDWRRKKDRETTEEVPEKGSTADKLKGLLIAIVVVLIGAHAYQYGKAEGQRESEVYWITQMTRRHLAYWKISPDGEPSIRFRYVPKVRPTCVIFTNEEGNER